MITLDMSKKNVGARVNDRMFSIDNGILTLQINVVDGVGAYDLTGKTITAIFDKTGYETQPLVPVDGIINIPITNDMIEVGENIFRLNFRWGTSSFEQSPSMTWFIMSGLGGKITFESVNIVGYLISQLNSANLTITEAESIRNQGEGLRDEAEQLRIEAETTRTESESNRDGAELVRVESEIGRNAAEVERAQFYNDFNSQLAQITTQKSDVSYVDTKVAAVASGSPKGVFLTLVALQADAIANTTDGKKSIYIVKNPFADDKDYWYYWNGSMWTVGGVYQSTGVGDGTIKGSNLDKEYSYKGLLNAGENLNTIVNAGAYYFNAANVTNEPTGVTGYNLLEVIRVYERWIIQKVYVIGTPHIVWYRRIDGDTYTPTTWVKSINTSADVKALLASDKLTVSHLSDNFSDRGTITNIDTAYTQGGHLFTFASTTGTFPSDWGTSSGLLIVDNTSNRWIIQHLYRLNNPGVQYVRQIDKNTPTIGAWSKISDLRPLLGKKHLCFGDSLTEDDAYDNYIASRTGMTVYNVGFGGCRMSYHTTPDYDKLSMTKLADAIVSGDWTAQDAAVANLIITKSDDNTAALNTLKSIDFNTINSITINYGTNDFGGGVPIGVNTDADSTTFKGAINYVVSKLLTAFPHLKIFFVTPAWRARIESGDGKDVDVYPNANGDFLIEYIDAEKEVAALNKLPCLDMYRNSGINKYNHTLYLSDGLHGTATGYELIGNKIASFIVASS